MIETTLVDHGLVGDLQAAASIATDGSSDRLGRQPRARTVRMPDPGVRHLTGIPLQGP
jgi:hypothetical protein